MEVLGFALTYANLTIELSRMGILYPHIEDTLDCLHGAEWFSTLDLNLVIGRVLYLPWVHLVSENVNACPLDSPMPQQPFKG